MPPRSIRSVEGGIGEAINRLRHTSGAQRAQVTSYFTGQSNVARNLPSAADVSFISSSRRYGSNQSPSSRRSNGVSSAGSAIDRATKPKRTGTAIPRGPAAVRGSRYLRLGSPQVNDSLGTGLPSRGVEPNGNTVDYSSQRVNNNSVVGSIGDFLSSGSRGGRAGSGSGSYSGSSGTRRRYG